MNIQVAKVLTCDVSSKLSDHYHHLQNKPQEQTNRWQKTTTNALTQTQRKRDRERERERKIDTQRCNLRGHHSFFSVLGRLFTSFFCNETAEFTQSLYAHDSLNSRANVITRTYIHYSQRMVLANAPPYSRVCWWLPTQANHWKQTDKQIWERGRMMMRCSGFIPITNHAKLLYLFSSGPWQMVHESLQSHSHIHSNHASCGH